MLVCCYSCDGSLPSGNAGVKQSAASAAVVVVVVVVDTLRRKNEVPKRIHSQEHSFSLGYLLLSPTAHES